METIKRVKVFLFLGVWVISFSFLGKILGGNILMSMFFILSFLIGLFYYYFSDKIILKIYNAKPLPYHKFPEIHHIVREVSEIAGIKKPKIYILSTLHPNIFSTGKNSNEGAIIFTYGILKKLSLREIKAVVAHEIFHIKNGDSFIQILSAAFAATITSIANIFRWLITFGMETENKKGNFLYFLILGILSPVASLLIHLLISKNREYIADRIASKFTNDPLALAGALEKLNFMIKKFPLEINPATSHIFILNPLKSQSFIFKFFNAHPEVEERIENLRKLSYVI